MKTTLWCTYHKSEIPNEYNLYDSKYLKLYNDDDMSLKEDNINFLHDYLGELTTFYYVWKNNKKSDIVGFCHYSKHMKFINYKRLKQFGFDAYSPCYFNSEEAIDRLINSSTHISNSLILYLKQKYNINIFKYLKEHQTIYESWHNIYLFTWDTFCGLCDFIFGLFEFILPNNSWKNVDNIDLLSQIHIPFNKEEICYGKTWFKRNIVIQFEFIIGMYLGIMHTNQIHNEYFIYSDHNEDLYFITCKDNFKDIDILKKWLKQNIKTGVTNYIIRSDLDKQVVFNEIQYPLGSIMNKYIYKLIICNSDSEFDNEVMSYNHDNKFINISLTQNQRIKCDSSIEMYKGNFSIENNNL